jgi:nicotinamide riboside transporter PnuC
MIGYLIFILLGVVLSIAGPYTWIKYKKDLATGKCIEGSDKGFGKWGTIIGTPIGLLLTIYMIIQAIKDFQ